jgi:hypothetical protein
MKIHQLVRLAQPSVLGNAILFALSPDDVIAVRDEMHSMETAGNYGAEAPELRKILYSWRVAGVPVQELRAQDGHSFWISAAHRLHYIEWKAF